MTQTADTVVVGGGIVGTCVALQLQRSGRAVTLVERGTPGSEASGHNAGVFSNDCLPTGLPSVIRSLPHLLVDPMSPLAIRWRYLPRLAPWLLRFALASRASRVERISAALGSLTGHGVDAYRSLIAGTEAEAILSNRGYLLAYRQRDPRDAARFALGLRTRRGVEYEILDADAIALRHPVLAGRFQHGVYLPRARFTRDPGEFTRALARALVAEGGRIEQATVTGFSCRGDAVVSVDTTGGPILPETVVIAAGPWSHTLAGELGTWLPLGVERGYGIEIPDAGLALDCPVVIADFNISVSPHRNGIRITGLDELAGIAAAPDFALTRRIVRAATTAFPGLRLDGATTWMRSRPSMPDSLPVIGRAPRHRNVYLAFGHGHKGLGTGAITGQLVRELVDGRPPTIDLAPFSPTRFSRRAEQTAANS